MVSRITPNGRYAYVSNSGSNDVSVIDTSTNAVTTTIAVGATPNNIAITPDGSEAYVANSGSNDVSVIDTSTNAVTTTVPLSTEPQGVTFTPDGQTAYVTNYTGSSVSVISTSNNAVTGTIGVGTGPYGVAVSPNGLTAYVTNSGDSTVSLINTADDTVTNTIPVGAGPEGVAVTSNGLDVYIADSGDGTVSDLNTVNETVGTIPVGSAPNTLAVTPDGLSVYVANGSSDSVNVIRTSDDTFTGSIAVGTAPQGVAMSPDTGLAVTGISTSSGPAAGGTAVSIYGTGFVVGNSTVSFGTTTDTTASCSSSTICNATAPAAGAGLVDVTVTTPDGTSAHSPSDEFTYVDAPVVTSLNPATGSALGATAVVITGTDLDGATAVTVGGAAATGLHVVNDTTLDATTPAGTAGPADVVVTTPYGTSGVSGAGAFTYVGPVVTSLSPATGPADTAGTTVIITGTDLDPASVVDFGGLPATYTVNSATQITATAPAAGAGLVDVTVTTPDGTSAHSPSDEFTYVDAPVVTSLNPATGSALGATAVVITGTDLDGATAVTVGGAAATGLHVVNDTTLDATTPAGTAGPADVVVTTPYGTSGVSGAGAFTYVGPVVTSLSPATGPADTAGTTVIITGTDLDPASVVDFGGLPATYTVNSATQITATAPAAGAGLVDVTVTTPDGTSAHSPSDEFTYVDAPVVTSLNPATGSALGATAVVITGTDLDGATAVTVGGAAATGLHVVNDTTLDATTPAGTAGPADVVVTTPYGTSGVSGAGAFTYVGPVVTSLSPATGPADTAGTTVIITGTDLDPASVVDFGGLPATYTVNSATQITATAPAAGAGLVDVTVTTPDGTSAHSPSDEFTYVDAPVVTSLNPATGSALGATAVVITGTDLDGATAVTVGGAAATGLHVVNDTTLDATTPAGTAGPADVVVTTPYGTSGVSGAGAFTYVGPVVTSLSPATGPADTAGTTVIITGTDLDPASVVDFGGLPATYTVNSATQITATAPAAGAGLVDVTVTTPDGTSAHSPSDEFTYVDAPVVTSLNPATGSALGATAVVITGTDLDGATAVTVGGAAATGLHVVNDTTLDATTPAGTAGPADVVVTTPYGTSGVSGAGAFTYVGPGGHLPQPGHRPGRHRRHHRHHHRHRPRPGLGGRLRGPARHLHRQLGHPDHRHRPGGRRRPGGRHRHHPRRHLGPQPER